jgi:hypothetical protein
MWIYSPKQLWKFIEFAVAKSYIGEKRRNDVKRMHVNPSTWNNEIK